MNEFLELKSSANLDDQVLAHELGVTPARIDDWVVGRESAPAYVVRALRQIARYADCHTVVSDHSGVAKPQRASEQLSLPTMCPIQAAVDSLSSAGIEERGAIFTRGEVAEFILDLVGYTLDQPLHELRLLEPSCGAGDFLFPAVDRLLIAWMKSGSSPSTLEQAICAVELHAESAASTRASLVMRLRQSGLSHHEATKIAAKWLLQGDFLLADIDDEFDVVVGNPPYVRQELIPDALMAEYRRRYSTIFDRADIYVPFIERSLSLLRTGGKCGFICSDRWMKNRYGAPLRKLVAEGFHLETYVDMVGTPAFHSDVIAYPAITVIARDKGRITRAAYRPAIDQTFLKALAGKLRDGSVDDGIHELPDVAAGSDPLMLDASPQLGLIRRLERDFPSIEAAGCKVGIGVATGADNAFIGRFDELEVEPDRKLPLVMTRDIQHGHVQWRGFGVVNPFGPTGKLVDLQQFPRLHGYLEARRSLIDKRHVAQKAPANWYRTIDRIYPEIASKPKLLIPDIKGEAHIVFENEGLYPHHNLYFITSDTWDVQALQAVLLSGIAKLFVAAYSTKMRGGFLRFQAQYLRRIRIPDWKIVPPVIREELREAAEKGDVASCNEAVAHLYRLSTEERAALRGE